MSSERKYFGDVRDRFDELYPTAASFVRLPTAELCKGRHIGFYADLANPATTDLFSRMCYAYEDTYDWETLPLVYLGSSDSARILWRFGHLTIKEMPLTTGLVDFDSNCETLLRFEV